MTKTLRRNINYIEFQEVTGAKKYIYYRCIITTLTATVKYKEGRRRSVESDDTTGNYTVTNLFVTVR